MKKRELRQLALGFLVSAIILSGYALFFTEDNTATPVEETSTSSEVAQNETETSSVEEDNNSEENSQDTNNEEQESASSEENTTIESSSEETTSESEPVLNEVTITINEGDTSDVIIDNLVALGIVEDGDDFYNYLTNNGFDTLIKPGDHEVNNQMDYYDLAQELMSF